MGTSITSLNDVVAYMTSYIPIWSDITSEHILAALPFAFQLALL